MVLWPDISPTCFATHRVAITVLINPSYAWGDVGWQLSFAAFAGVMLLAPLLQSYYFGDKKPGTVRQILGETIAATLADVTDTALSFWLYFEREYICEPTDITACSAGYATYLCSGNRSTPHSVYGRRRSGHQHIYC